MQPDNSKSTLDKVSDSLTGAGDKAQRYVTDDTSLHCLSHVLIISQ